MTTPLKNDRKKPVEAIFVAVSWRRAPSSREMKLPDPWPKKNPTACTKNIIENTTPTAAVAWVLICPTKKVSARL